MEQGSKLICINISVLSDTGIKPPLELNREYELKEVIHDKAGNPHYDVGLKSKYNFIRSLETKEELPNGDKIHWCHPSRFKPAE